GTCPGEGDWPRARRAATATKIAQNNLPGICSPFWSLVETGYARKNRCRQGTRKDFSFDLAGWRGAARLGIDWLILVFCSVFRTNLVYVFENTGGSTNELFGR